METLSIYTSIKNSLPEAYWNRVIHSLKCDPIVWDSIQNPRFIEQLRVGQNEITDWSPANLGLKLINFKSSATHLQNIQSPVMDENLYHKAESLLESARLANNVSNLEDAILIALFIREKLVLGESWLSVRNEFLGNQLDNYYSVFTCLYGLINNPNDFLAECISIDNSFENYLLLLHAIISNPIETDQQVRILNRLLTKRNRNNLLSALEIYKFIQHIYLIHPDLALKLSETLINHHKRYAKIDNSSNNVINILHNLEDQLLHSELHNLSNNQETSQKYIISTLSNLLNVWMEIAPKIQAISLDQKSSLETIEGKTLFVHKQLMELLTREGWANPSIPYTNTLMSFIENRQYNEAEEFINEKGGNNPSVFINNLVLAINSNDQGDKDQSILHAQNAVTTIVANNPEFINLLSNHSERILIPFLELLLNLNLIPEALMITRQAITYRGSDAKLYAILGEASIANYAPEDATEAFFNAMLLKPDDLNIRRQLAMCLEEIGMWNEAYFERKHILDASTKHGSNPEIEDLHKAIECAINMHSLDVALTLCDQAILLDSENGYTYSLIGKALINRENPEKAFENFEKGIQISPHIPGTWLSLANAQYSAEDLDQVIETLHAALHAIPTSADIHLALGEMQLAQNALTEALNTFRSGAELEPNNTKMALKLGTTLQLLGHIDDAEQVLEKAHAMTPNHLGIAYAYSKVLLQKDEKIKAIPILYIVVKSNPKSIESYLEFAEAVLSSKAISDGQYSPDEILSVIQRALEFDPHSPVVHALLGESLTIKGDYKNAKDAYQVALESNLVEDENWFARLSLGMGRVALALGQEDVALASLQEALTVDPNNSLIHQALCEVYRAVNLPENALQAARAAANLGINDIDTLTWYADQMLALSEVDAIQHSQSSSNEFQKQIQSEALNALHQANQIAPTRADLLVKLGRIQSILGDNASALTTLNSLIDNVHANVKDLTTAGEHLSELGDTCGAITCLEQAYAKVQKLSSHSTSTLLINLARLYQIDGDNESALHTLDRALENNPAFGPVYYAKANLLQELNNEDDAILCIAEGLEKSVDTESRIQLHTLAGNLFRRRGEIKLALGDAQLGLSLCNTDQIKQELQIDVVIDIITLTSDLFTATLKPNRSRLLLKEMERKFKIRLTDDIDYCCSYVELFFDALDQEELTSIISQIIEINPDHPRILALQARLFKRRRDYHTSLNILHTALEAANRKIWSAKEKDKSLPSTTSLPIWYSLCDSALELFQWDTAFYTVHHALELAPLEPQAHLNLARAIVMRAEYQRLCEKTNVTTNSPGATATNQDSRAVFEQAISDAIQLLKSLEPDLADGETQSEPGKLNSNINRWIARGLAIFGTEDEVKQAVSDLAKLTSQSDGSTNHANTDDISALIGADFRLSAIDDNDKLNKLTHMARTNLNDPNLLLQVALTLAETKPQNAINLLRELAGISHSKDNPLVAMGKALLARLLIENNEHENAKIAIDEALEIFNNEPKWHIIAAGIYQNICNVIEAIHHFDEAIQLEPHNLENHLGLGKLLIENAEFEPTNLKRAIQVLERACRLEPENPDPWFYLSRAYLSMMDINQAASYADMAISLDPENINLFSLRGEIALHQNNPQAALDFASQALKIHEHETQAILIKSQALRDLGRVNQALEVIETAMEYMEDPLTLHIEYAILLNDVRGPQASIAALEQLVELNPENPEILSLLAKNMAETGQIETAIKTAQRALHVSNGSHPNTDKAELHHLLGSLLIKTRQLDQAIHHLSESIALTPNYIDSYLELGLAQQEKRQYRQALDILKKATRIAPNDPRPHFQAGIAYKEAKDYQAAESMLRRAADLAPDDVTIRRQLAAVVALNLVHNPRTKRIVEE